MKGVRRGGYTLIESLVVIALTGVTLSVVAVTMHGLYRAERRVRDDLQRERTRGQIATQLRWDAHEALSATTAGGEDALPPRTVTLTLPGQRSIQYSITENRLERIVRKGESMEHREDYRWAVAGGHWSIDASRGRPLLTLHLIPFAPSSAGLPETTRLPSIQAAVGISAAPGRKEKRHADPS